MLFLSPLIHCLVYFQTYTSIVFIIGDYISIMKLSLFSVVTNWFVQPVMQMGNLLRAYKSIILARNVSLFEFGTKNRLAEWILCLHELMIALLPFTSLVLEMPNMVCFVRTNSLINLVHIRKFGSCSIASLI